jgi:hypothetical protein
LDASPLSGRAGVGFKLISSLLWLVHKNIKFEKTSSSFVTISRQRKH